MFVRERRLRNQQIERFEFQLLCDPLIILSSIHAFLIFIDFKVDVPEIGQVTADIVFGGAFYALVPDFKIGVDLEKTETNEISRVAYSVTSM